METTQINKIYGVPRLLSKTRITQSRFFGKISKNKHLSGKNIRRMEHFMF